MYVFRALSDRNDIGAYIANGAADKVEADHGDILVSDGYGQNWMHRFSAT